MRIGVDEAGRGALAGPVVAAAVWLREDAPISGLDDSKRLSAKRRTALAERIRDEAAAWAVAEIAADVIDRINILQASLQAMHDAVLGLARMAQERGSPLTPRAPSLQVLVDGQQLPTWDWPARAVVGGDGSEACIMAASILAKVHRDGCMQAYDAEFPGYGFGAHKGYPTGAHVSALQRLGPSCLHRRSFGPVARCLGGATTDALRSAGSAQLSPLSE